jgi:UDP-glucose 4-epimerase
MKVDTVIGISTDKACKPVNVMGFSKAIQERILNHANLLCPATRCLTVRYGNVIGSRGSAIPLFIDQVRSGGPVTLTTPDMTRFLLSLEQAVDAVFVALQSGQPGETLVPRLPSARMLDVAEVIIAGQDIPISITGMRPGEKTHEVLFSEEEALRTYERGDYYVISPILPELATVHPGVTLTEYSSANNLLSRDALKVLLEEHLGHQAEIL